MNSPKKAKKNTAPAAKSNTLFLAALALITGITLSPVLFNGFINLDDPQYLLSNPAVQSFSSSNLKAIFTDAFVGNYQPVTMLSYMVEYAFIGKGAGVFHFFSLLFHLLNTLLVFLIFRKMTGSQVLAFVTAILFGIHPLHVESVAWVSARKDVLYTLWFLLSLWFYLAHIQREGHSKKFYFLAMLCFLLSLLSKAQAVILPVTFFLADFLIKRKFSRKTLLEKLPFFALSLIFGCVAFVIQKKSGAVQDYSYFSFDKRLLFSCYGLANYFYKTLLPIQLSSFYPYPETNDRINSVWVYISPLILLALGYFSFREGRRSRELTFGLVFFLVTIFLVLQLIPVGDAVMADRYTYLSSVGLFFITGHYFQRYAMQRPSSKKILQATGWIIIAVLCVLSFNRSRQWKDSISLYSHDLLHHPAAISYNNLGVAYVDKKMYKEAAENFARAVALKPRFPSGYKNLGLTWELLNENDKAIEAFNYAIQYFPNEENNYLFRGKVHMKKGNNEAALADFAKVISMNPENADAYYIRAQIYGNQGKHQQSLDDMNKVMELRPGLPEGYGNRGIVLSMMGRYEEALKDFDEALRLNPSAINTYMNRSLAWKGLGNYAKALEDALTAKQKGNPVDENYLRQLQELAGTRE